MRHGAMGEVYGGRCIDTLLHETRDVAQFLGELHGATLTLMLGDPLTSHPLLQTGKVGASCKLATVEGLASAYIV